MASSLISNPISISDRSRESSRKKRKKKSQKESNNQDQTKWKSKSQHQIYSSKLIQALNQRRINPDFSSQTVRETSYTVLAMADKGKNRWSRAILTKRLKIKFRKKKNEKKGNGLLGQNRTKKPRVRVLRLKGKGLPALQRKVRLLGRIVPGCRKQALPVILEEVIDYIPALEMQIRVMSVIDNLFSAASSSS